MVWYVRRIVENRRGKSGERSQGTFLSPVLPAKRTGVFFPCLPNSSLRDGEAKYQQPTISSDFQEEGMLMFSSCGGSCCFLGGFFFGSSCSCSGCSLLKKHLKILSIELKIMHWKRQMSRIFHFFLDKSA